MGQGLEANEDGRANVPGTLALRVSNLRSAAWSNAADFVYAILKAGLVPRRQKIPRCAR